MFNFPPNVLALGMIRSRPSLGRWEVREIRDEVCFRGLAYDRVIFLRRPSQQEWDAAHFSVRRSGGDVTRAYVENP